MKVDFHKAVLIFSILWMLFVIYQLIRKILGGSWGVEEQQNTAIFAIVGYIFYLTIQVSTLNGKFSQFEKRFNVMAAELKLLKDDVSSIKGDIKLIKNKLAA